MKRTPLIVALILLVVVGAVGLGFFMSPKQGTVVSFASLRDPAIGGAYVVGHYDGFGRGWDVALFHRNLEGQLLGYYLAHESPRWGDAALRADRDLIIVESDGKRVAEYSPRTGSFAHKLQGVVYSKQEGIEGGSGRPKWDLSVIEAQ